MAFQPKAFYANGTIAVGRFVKLDPAVNNAVIQGTLNCRTFGISTIAGCEPPIPSQTTSPPNAADAAGQDVMVYTLGMECLLQAGSGGWGNQAELYSDANGNGLSAAGVGKRIGALALESANVNEYGLVQVVMYDKAEASS